MADGVEYVLYIVGTKEKGPIGPFFTFSLFNSFRYNDVFSIICQNCKKFEAVDFL